jgi:hypothetical protein
MWNTLDISAIRSDRALVATQEHRSSAGAGTVSYVVLADGFLLDCGHGFNSENRAIALATIINAAPHEMRLKLDLWNKAQHEKDAAE